MKESKICKCCGIEKPVKDFRIDGKSFKSNCRVCEFKKRNCIKYKENWSQEQYDIILDCIINKRFKYINDIVPLLNNKELYELLDLLSFDLIIKNKKIRFILKCPVCNDEFECTLSKYKNSNNNFCSHKCSVKLNSELNKKRSTKKCLCCGNIYEYNLRDKFTSKFCSNDCKITWQRKNSLKGKDNPQFKRIKVKCDWCEKYFYKRRDRILRTNNNFCCNECYVKWNKNVYWKDENNINKSRERMSKLLESGRYSNANTSIQKKINNLLDLEGIEYKNEKSFKYYNIDNYIVKNSLCIECMGRFWHCDSRFYDRIKNNIQKNRINKDKTKRKYIKNKHSIDILYLWEDDINNEINICRKLIFKYIQNDGGLENYHSFNYYIDNNGCLQLKNKLIKAYMEYDKEELEKFIELKE